MSVIWGWTNTGPFWKWQHALDLMGITAKSGVNINHGNSLSVTAYYAGVTLIAQTLAQVPLPVYKYLGRGKEKAREHQLYELLHDAPNPYMTAFDFKEAMQGHAINWGNAFAEIEWEGDTCKALWPLRPDHMKLQWKDGKLLYIYTVPSGDQVPVSPANIFHIKGFSADGLIGYDPITLFRETLGLAKATEEFGARFFANGSEPGGILTHPGTLSDPARKNMSESWDQVHQGLNQSHRIAILEEGVTWQKVGIDPENAQFLETRKFQTSEIARWLHIPPHMLGDLEKATFSNIEHQGIQFVVYTMTSWFVKWEQMIKAKLLSRADRQKYFAEFMVQGLLRGDSESRAKYYKERFFMGSMSPNDIREKENENPITGGDEYYVPLNMMPVGQPPIREDDSASTRARTLAMVEGKARAGLQRSGIADAHRRLFNVVGRRLVGVEAMAIRASLASFFPEETTRKSLGEWTNWLDEYYKSYRIEIQEQMAPAILVLAEAIQEVAAGEVNVDIGVTPELENFLHDYAEGFATRYINASKGQLKELVAEAMEPAQAIESVGTRLKEWEETRPGKIGLNETVQLSNAVAKQIFIGAGITRLQWVAMGSKVCPICQEMNGRIVGIEENFLNADAVLSAEGRSSFSINRPTSHPPLHGGCVCQIVAI